MATYRVIKNKKAYLRRRRIRFFLVTTILIGIFAYTAHTTYANRLSRLEEARLELQMYQEQYDEIMLRQGFYYNQITRLEDESYILMFARERHFWSLPGEVIFRFTDPTRGIDTNN